MGAVIAGAALSVWHKCEPLAAGRIRFGRETVRVPSNRPKPEEMDEARRIDALHRAGRDAELPYKGMDLTTKVAAAQRKVELEHGPDFFDLPLDAFSVGSVAFANVLAFIYRLCYVHRNLGVSVVQILRRAFVPTNVI